MIPERRKEVRAVVTAEWRRASRVNAPRSLARCTWMMEDRERLEATRWGMSLSRGDDAGGSESIVGLLAASGDNGGAREELEDVIIEGLTLPSSCLFETWGVKSWDGSLTSSSPLRLTFRCNEEYNGCFSFRHFAMKFPEIPLKRNTASSFKESLIGSSDDLQHTTGAKVSGNASG